VTPQEKITCCYVRETEGPRHFLKELNVTPKNFHWGTGCVWYGSILLKMNFFDTDTSTLKLRKKKLGQHFSVTIRIHSERLSVVLEKKSGPIICVEHIAHQTVTFGVLRHSSCYYCWFTSSGQLGFCKDETLNQYLKAYVPLIPWSQ